MSTIHPSTSPSVLMWCSLHVVCVSTKINVRALHVNFSHSCLQTCDILKNTREESHMLLTRMLKV